MGCCTSRDLQLVCSSANQAKGAYPGKVCSFFGTTVYFAALLHIQLFPMISTCLLTSPCFVCMCPWLRDGPRQFTQTDGRQGFIARNASEEEEESAAAKAAAAATAATTAEAAEAEAAACCCKLKETSLQS
jgi:hypothetical protein